MDKKTLYDLPKDILVKLITDIQERTKQDLYDFLLEDEWELEYLQKLRLIYRFKDKDPVIIENCKKVLKKFVMICSGCISIYPGDNNTIIIRGGYEFRYEMNVRKDGVVYNGGLYTVEEFNKYIN